MQGEPTDPRRPAVTDNRYFLVVGVLLLMIVLLLAALWVRERRTNAALLQDISLLQRAGTSKQQLQTVLKQMVGRAGGAAWRPLQREDLPAETVQWNGRPRQALRVSAAAGERMGLHPGDVLVVSEPPATAPTTTSAPAKAD